MKLLILIIFFAINLNVQARSLFNEAIEETSKDRTQLRMPASTASDEDITNLLIKKKFKIIKSGNKTLAVKGKKEFLIHKNKICFNKDINLHNLAKSGFEVSSNEGAIYIYKNEKSWLIHPSNNYLCKNQ